MSSSLPRAARRAVAFCAAFAVAALVALRPVMAQSLLRDAEIEAFLDDYSLPIFRVAGLPAEEINILLIGDQTPNAFAGGLNMGIHTGLLTTADTPNQIEGVIAHEAGHIKLKHTVRSDEAIAAATRPIYLSLLLAAGAVAAGAPQAGIGLLGLGQNIGLANVLKYSRGQESSADQSAITALDRVGHSSKGLIEFFSKLRNYQVNTGFRVNPYLQTHPLANQRITALPTRAQNSPYYDVEDSPEEIHRLRMIQAKIHGFLDNPQDALQRYPPEQETDPARYARAVAYFRMSQIDKGLAEIDALLEKHPENAYFHELKGQMLFEFGRVEESIQPHRRSVQLQPDEALFQVNLGRAYFATEDKSKYPSALGHLKASLLEEPHNSLAWFEMSRVYGAMGDEPRAYLARAEASYHAGDIVGANQSARRALRGLDRNTPDAQRAQDILLAVEAAAERRSRR
ncbi:MAG: M48 family metalloprotease [Parvularculaceae bacterium]